MFIITPATDLTKATATSQWETLSKLEWVRPVHADRFPSPAAAVAYAAHWGVTEAVAVRKIRMGARVSRVPECVVSFGEA